MSWPAMTRKETILFIKKHTKECRCNSVTIFGINKNDETFTFHVPHGERTWPELTARIAKRLCIDRSEFYLWWNNCKRYCE